MRVLVLTATYPHPADPSEGLFNEQHALALAQVGVRVTIFVCKPWLPNQLARRWERYGALAKLPPYEKRSGIEVRYIRYLHIPSYQVPHITVASCTREILKTIRRFHRLETFDLIQVHGTWPAGFAAPIVSRFLGCPFVLTMHIQDDRRLLSNPSGARFHKRMIERSSAVVTVGQPLSRFLKEWIKDFPLEKFRNIPNGVDLDLVKELLETTPQNHGSWGNIVSVGNLWPTKGIDLNLRALARLNKRGEAWHEYTIIGEGPERPKLESLAQDLGIGAKVLFTGRLEHRETLQEIARADIFSLPSWREAFGIAYLEAMACGKPVIGCRGQGAEDIIRPEIDGMLVQPKSVEGLEGALKHLLENPDCARKLGNSGKSRTQEFTWERNAAQYLELYRKICPH
jgi:glycosyltransferase involved in cell wall biosynthesis